MKLPLKKAIDPLPLISFLFVSNTNLFVIKLSEVYRTFAVKFLMSPYCDEEALRELIAKLNTLESKLKSFKTKSIFENNFLELSSFISSETSSDVFNSKIFD